MVSVVIPAYNRAKVVGRAIESCLNQTYRDIEVIVVDDGSSDNTKEVVEAIDDERLSYVYQDNAGACAARNHGIEMAKGEYIAFQDSDDEWHTDKIEKQMAALIENNADFVFCGFIKVNSNGQRNNIPENIKPQFYKQKELIYESIVSTQTIFGKASAVKDVMFDEAMPRMQDYDFIIRASSCYSIYCVPEYLVNVFEQPDSITASKKQYQKRLEITEKLLRKYPEYREQYPKWNIKMLKIMAHCQVMLGEDAGEVLKEINSIEPSAGNKIKLILNKFGMLKSILTFREEK